MVVGLSLFAGVICFLLKIVYWDWLKIPIGLGGGLFFLIAVPIVLILSVPYSAIMVWTLSKSNYRSTQRAFLISFGIGALVILVLLGISFPCEVEPYFMGGYLFRMWFARQ